MNDEHPTDEPEYHMLPPKLLLVSFTMVAGAYIISLMAFWLTFMGLARFAFPEVLPILLQSPEEVKVVMAEDPGSIFTTGMMWSLLTINGLVCFSLGWLIVKLAPFGKFPHAVFLSVIILVSMLQQSIAQPEAAKRYFTMMMIVFPIATMIGAQIAHSRWLKNADNQVIVENETNVG